MSCTDVDALRGSPGALCQSTSASSRVCTVARRAGNSYRQTTRAGATEIDSSTGVEWAGYAKAMVSGLHLSAGVDESSSDVNTLARLGRGRGRGGWPCR